MEFSALDFTIFPIATVIQLVGSVAGYTFAIRAGHSRLAVIIASAVGGSLAGIVFGLWAASKGSAFAFGLPFVLLSFLIGTSIGFAGLIAREIGACSAVGREKVTSHF